MPNGFIDQILLYQFQYISKYFLLTFHSFSSQYLEMDACSEIGFLCSEVALEHKSTVFCRPKKCHANQMGCFLFGFTKSQMSTFYCVECNFVCLKQLFDQAFHQYEWAYKLTSAVLGDWWWQSRTSKNNSTHFGRAKVSYPADISPVRIIYIKGPTLCARNLCLSSRPSARR